MTSVIMKYETTSNTLQQIVNGVYGRRAAGVEKISNYTLTGAGWKFSGFSTKRRFGNIPGRVLRNDSVDQVMNIVQDFRNDAREHKSLGLFLQGSARSGKSIMANVIASEYNMPIYKLPLNAHFLSNAVLDDSMRSIPEKSIIFIDEIYHKIEPLLQRKESYITIGGILEVLDDQHIPNGCILLVTSISAEETAKLFPDGTLLGLGRLSNIITMNYQN